MEERGRLLEKREKPLEDMGKALGKWGKLQTLYTTVKNKETSESAILTEFERFLDQFQLLIGVRFKGVLPINDHFPSHFWFLGFLVDR